MLDSAPVVFSVSTMFLKQNGCLTDSYGQRETAGRKWTDDWEEGKEKRKDLENDLGCAKHL